MGRCFTRMSEEITIVNYEVTSNIVADACKIIDTSQQSAFQAINVTLIKRNWLLGKRIAEEELASNKRVDNYGLEIIKNLSKHLLAKYGKGFSKRALYQYLEFYRAYPDIVQSLIAQSFPLLSWTHYCLLLRVKDLKAREWYAKEAFKETWSVRTLERNISTQYYYRLLKSQVQEPVINEMKTNTSAYKQDKLEFIKNPVVAEFLGMSPDKSFSENDLETSIISHLKQFIMELGKGYAFVTRQQHIRTETSDFYIDLVFYNYILKCFVLVDLKIGKITHQDIGQMDMYIRMYDDLKRTEGDNPTLGIVLCDETDATIAKYSVLKGNEQLFATKYKLYLPTDEELRAEIESQKAIFNLQHGSN